MKAFDLRPLSFSTPGSTKTFRPPCDVFMNLIKEMKSETANEEVCILTYHIHGSHHPRQFPLCASKGTRQSKDTHLK